MNIRPMYMLAAAVVVLLALLLVSTDLIVNWLWMKELGYEGVFRRLLLLKFSLFAGTSVFVFLFSYCNLRFFLRGRFPIKAAGEIQVFGEHQLDLSVRRFKWLTLIFSGFLAVFFGLALAGNWDEVLRFIWRTPFGRTDPVYNRDLGFYLFELPFYDVLQDSLTFLALIIFIALLVLNVFLSQESRALETLRRSHRGFRQVSFCFFLFLLAWGWGYYLERYQLLLSPEGVVFGAGWTDLHVVRIGLWLMVAASIILAILIEADAFYRKPLISLIGIGVYVLCGVVALNVAPGLVQSFVVEPNELEKESPYLRHNIKMTRLAYGLDRVRENDYPALADLTLDKVLNNEKTLRNIRLWDWRPLRQTYRQMQEIRLYYQFYNVDAERYLLGGDDYRQVMASARELAQELPGRANTWVNRVLQFTHGYGVVMSLASQRREDGVPEYLVRNLPPESVEGLEVEKPAIYYGENLPGYKIVNTGVKELDYPRGDRNVYTSYGGRGGVLLDAFWKKLVFAWELSDINIVLSDYLKPESRIQIWHRIQERIRRIAPFLELDSDPYIVVNQKGELHWIQDIYTVSEHFPYSEPAGRRGFNYIRNSVKAVVDAYHGTADFYVMDPGDPVFQVYRAAFPGLFKDLGQLSGGMKPHLRYPYDLFTIQVEKYNRYHMTIPQVFYNNEDLWTMPREKYAGKPIPMEPYYILIRMPGEEKLEFLLMIPLTPSNRDNMIAWLVARCDFPDYGEMVVFKLPKERLIYGPLQVEAMIDQNAEISRQLSLWDQRGSRVIRGNLLVIPVDRSFLYVEPVYLIAEENDIPQLRRVIVAYGDQVAMEPTLDKAVRALFGTPRAAPARQEGGQEGMEDMQLPDLREILRRAQRSLEQGDWEAFGREMGKLQKRLEPDRKE